MGETIAASDHKISGVIHILLVESLTLLQKRNFMKMYWHLRVIFLMWSVTFTIEYM